MIIESNIYHCTEGSSNKFWKYTIQKDGSDYSVLIEWGRIGQSGQKQTKKFRSESSAKGFINKKLTEKTDKGYTLKTKTDHNKSVNVANKLGYQYKISDIHWCKIYGSNKISYIPEYDPEKHVLVTIMNSWSKDEYHVLLSKEDSKSVHLSEISNIGARFSASYGTPANFESAAREYLKSVAVAVQEVAKKIWGGRILDGFGGPSTTAVPTETEIDDLYEQIADNSVSKDVVRKFASLGGRVLDL